jgi:hypothetical protein
MEEVGLGDQIYEMMKGNLDEMERCWAGSVDGTKRHGRHGQGDIYYLRNGRADPCERRPSRPVPGHSSAHEWRGIHPLADLVRSIPDGWMQNCSCPRRDDARQPDGFREYQHPYLFRRWRGDPSTCPDDERLLAAADKVTVARAIDLAFNPRSTRLRSGRRAGKLTRSAPAMGRTGDAAEVFRQIEGWNRRPTPTRRSFGVLRLQASTRQELG